MKNASGTSFAQRFSHCRRTQVALALIDQSNAWFSPQILHLETPKSHSDPSTHRVGAGVGVPITELLLPATSIALYSRTRARDHHIHTPIHVNTTGMTTCSITNASSAGSIHSPGPWPAPHRGRPSGSRREGGEDSLRAKHGGERCGAAPGSALQRRWGAASGSETGFGKAAGRKAETQARFSASRGARRDLRRPSSHSALSARQSSHKICLRAPRPAPADRDRTGQRS